MQGESRMLSMQCPNCGKQLEIPEQYAGQQGKCTYCGHAITAPRGVHGMSFDPPPIPREMIPESTAKAKSEPVVMRAAKWGFGIGCGCLVIISCVFSASVFLAGLGVSSTIQTPASNAGPRIGIAPRSGHATLAEFQRLQTGMSYEQVVEIIGAEGTLVSSNTLPGVPGFSDPITTEMYSWEGHGGLGANMNAMFQNYALISKSQFGLK
jgi:DNA-directed RNA polymerase subunit RPC12/RpoP